MKKKKRTMWKLFALLVFTFCFTSLSFGQAVLPQPGEVINKSNYQKYKDLIPEGFYQAFEDGWGGLMPPISMKIKQTESATIPKVYREFSEKNRGKFTLDENGLIAGGYDYLGIPFPEVTPADKDFALKHIWNYTYKYTFDDYDQHLRIYLQRKGERAGFTQYWAPWQFFANRMFDPPKPIYPNPLGLQKAMFWLGEYPYSMKSQVLLQYRCLDPRKSDESYIYLPSLRRVLRGEAGQRSTPVTGSLVAMDDVENFDCRPQDFNFKFIKEQKVLGIVDNRPNQEAWKKWDSKVGTPWPSENWEVRDAYVIEVTPKDPRYPQSKKIITMDKENPATISWTIAWDRAGELWKVFFIATQKFPLADGTTTNYTNSQFTADIQFGAVSHVLMTDPKLNGNDFTYSMWTPAAIMAAGR